MDEKQREQARLRKKKQRDREKAKSVTNQENNVTQSPDSVTQAPENVTPHKDQYPALLYALTDPVKRQKLEKIHQSLKAHNVLKEVRYGVSGPTFDVVGDLLEATT